MIFRLLQSLTLAAALSLSAVFAHAQEEPKKFTVAWSIYVGWMPWYYIEETGLMDKWAKKYGIDVELVQINDYIEAINMYTAGRFDAATMTNMDLLTIPAASGVDTTALITGDYSNGNDAVVLKNGDSMEDIKGRDVYLLELSVSHYTLARALESAGMTERDITVVNTSDADIASAFNDPAVQASTLWNPQLEEVLKHPDAVKVFDSTEIPGEILDILAVKTETLEANPELGKALTGAWFEAMSIMNADDAEAKAAKQMMAAAAGTDLDGYQVQLDATELFYTPQQKLDFLTSEQAEKTMSFVTEFSFRHGLLGEGAPAPDAIGIELPDGEIWGNKNNVKMRFNNHFTQMAADGEL
ncbi:putative urea ABC transporter substrate-binding protein [Marinimicrobium sp. ARAG 43.8]|uniref:putative urea ABC transporter substrate-binding protein n=1 Tax=Marinimicrobium sp. ARAG 43.8 TaxID=3418719 RepID=UPI003CF61543